MKVFSHQHSRRLLFIPVDELSTGEQAKLAYHLAGCAECRAYASELQTLQHDLTRLMHARWDSLSPKTKSIPAVQQHWKEVHMKRRSFKFIAILAGIGAAVLLIVYGPALLWSLFPVVNSDPLAIGATQWSGARQPSCSQTSYPSVLLPSA